MRRTHWNDLPLRLRNAIETSTGPVRGAVTVDEGENSALAAVLELETGRIFVKGLQLDHPGVVTQARETAIAPYVRDISPRFLWQVQADGWNLTGFEHLSGRHADYAVGSPDLLPVALVMDRLGQRDCPELPTMKRAEIRWRSYVDDPEDASRLAGKVLLHTDWSPANVLITDDGAKLVDWAWPTLGASWLDPACWILRLIAAGHDVEGAERWAASVPAWHTATDTELAIFAAANARLWDEIAATDPKPFKISMRTAARTWASHRAGGRAREEV